MTDLALKFPRTTAQLIFGTLMLIVFGNVPAKAHDDVRHKETVTIDSAWAPHTGRRTFSAAVYLSIKNTGSKDLVLTGMQTPVANSATLHQSKETDGIMSMDHVMELPIPAGGSVNLMPGSYHIMLTRLTAPLKRGEVFPLTLSFGDAADVTITVEITGIGGPE